MQTPILTFTPLLLAATLFTPCSSGNGQGKQNSKHAPINTPPVAKEANLILKASISRSQ